MRVEAVHAAGDPDASKGAAPCHAVGFAAGLGAEWVRSVQPAPHNFIDLFLQIEDRFLDNRGKIPVPKSASKAAISNR